MARAVADRFTQLIIAVVGQPLSGWLFLRGADFDNEIAAWPQMLDGAGDEPIEDCKAVRTAVDRQTGFVIPNPAGQGGYIFMSNVGGIAQDKVKELVSG